MSVTLNEVMSAASKRASALASEVTGYLVLAIADQVAGAPRKVGFDEIVLAEEGTLRVASGRPVEDSVAEGALRALLAEMLMVSSSVTPALKRAGQRGSGPGTDALIRELEAALIPANRSAARRALARLHRDVSRAKAKTPLEPYVPLGERTATEAPVALRAAASIELPAAMLAGTAPAAAVETQESQPGASWRSPENVAITEIAWPGRVFLPEPDPVVEVSDDEIVIDEGTPVPLSLELQTPLMQDEVPEIPDLEAEPSQSATAIPPIVLESPASSEPETVPQPVVKRRMLAEATPPLGTRIGELVLTDPMPAIAELAPEDVTDPGRAVEWLGPETTEPIPEAVQHSAELDLFDEIDAGWSPVPPPPAVTEKLPPAEPDPCPIDLSPELPELCAVDFEPHEVFEPEPEAAITRLPDLESNRAPAAETAHTAQLELEISPLPPIDVNALETLAVLPRRPEASGYARPKYAPKKSDVDELVTEFSVAEVRSARDVCRDLRTLAGVEATQAPPVTISETPPPIDLPEGENQANLENSGWRLTSARVVAGAVSVALVLAGLGFGSIPTRDASAAAAGPQSAMCTAELTVRQVPDD